MDKVIRHGLEISAGLDKASQREMRQAVRDIFVEEAHIDFDNPENIKGLRALADIMKKIFQQAGNTKFDFSKMIELPGPEMFDALKKAAMEFDDVWSSIVQKFGKQSFKNIFMKDAGDLSRAVKDLGEAGGKAIEKQIRRAFQDVRLTDINKLLNEAIGAEVEFRSAESWEEQYAAALRYLNVYEKIKKVQKKDDFDVDDIEPQFMSVFKNINDPKYRLGPYLIQDIRDAAPQIQTSLLNIFRFARKEALVGLTEGGAIDFSVVPTISDPLTIGDIFGKKGKTSIEVPITFRAKLDLMRDLYEEGDFEPLEKLQDEIASMFPKDMRDVVLTRLDKFAQSEKITARSYQAIWKDFVGYGMPVGDGGLGTGVGIGDGSGSGDASFNEVEDGIERVTSRMRTYDEEIRRAHEHMIRLAKEGMSIYDESYDPFDDPLANRDFFKDFGDQDGHIDQDELFSTLSQKYGQVEYMNEDREHIRLKQSEEMVEQIEKAYKRLEEIDDPYEIEDEETLNRLYQERLDIIDRIGAENLKNYDRFKFDDIEKTNSYYRELLDDMEYRSAEQAAEKSFEELDGLYDKISGADDPDEANAYLEERKRILSEISPLVREQYEEAIEAEMQTNSLIEKRITLLRDAQAGRIDVDDIDDIMKETGDLESKLERLQDVSGDWGSKVKDSELDEDDDALEALQQFEETYDRIVLKLANGRNIEILPNAKGLRALYKYYDGIDSDAYGESEIEDVEFVRKEMQQTNQEAEQQAEVQVRANDAEIESNKEKIMSYEELTAVVKEYFDLKSQLKDEFNYSGMRRDAYAMTDKYEDIDTDEGKREQMMKDFNALWSEREKVKKSIKTGNTYIASDGQKYLGSERDIDRLTTEINGLSAAYINLGGSVDDFSSRAKKITAATSWNLFKKAEEQDLADNKVAKEINKPIEEKMQAIETALVKQQLNPDSIAVWSALEVDSGKFEDRLNSIAKALGIEIPQAAQQAEIAVGELNSELTKTGASTDNIGGQSGSDTIPDTSLGQTDGATTEEVENLEKVRVKVSEITREVAEKTKEFLAEQSAVKKVAQSEAHALGEVEKKVNAIRVALSNVNTLLNNIKKGKDIGTGLNNITVNVNHKKDEKKNGPWALEKTLLSVNEVLGQIQINTAKSESVEVAPASTDVGNVLATENTLAAIKTAVEAINKKVVKGTKATTYGGKQKSKQEAGELAPYVADDDADFTDDKDDTKSMKLLADISLQRKNLEKFIVQLQTAGKLTDEYQVWIDNLTTFLNGITSTDDMAIWKKAFARTKTSVGIDDIIGNAEDKTIAAAYEKIIELQKTRNKLELQYEKAKDGSALKQFYADQLAQMNNVIARQEEILENEEYEAKLARMREEQARKLGETEAKAADKVSKKTAADQKKLAKRQAMTGKASSAISRAEGVWLEAEGLEQAKLPKDFKEDVSEYYDALDQLRLKHHEINTSEVVTEEQQAELIRQTKEVNKLTEAIGPLVAEYQKLSGSNVDEKKSRATTLTGTSSLSDYEAQLKQYVKSITDGKGQIKSFNAETKTLTYTVKTGKNEFTEYTAAVRHLDHQMVAVQGTTKRTETFFEATKRKMKELTSYMSGMAIFSRVGQELRRGIQYVREIDLALTELKKVTDETEESYDKFLDTAAKTGARLGTTISAVTEATATFAKLGYSMEQATEMAEAAIVYKNVGDNIASTEDAADSIISTMKGFRLEASESMAIVDRFNEVGNRFAITSQGIGEALRLSASALSEGGNSLDESIGLITAANEVVNDPSSVGTALKTLTLRLRGSKTELEEMGEDVSDMATTTSQLQAKLLALTGGQVDIMLDENTFKNSTQILREMAEAWEDMNDIQRASALELMGGKRQANVLSALIQNFDTVEKVIETSANSAGSALEENERYLDSIQGKIDQFNNAMQAMWSDTLDSDVVKWFVGLGTELVKIVDTIGLIPSILAAILVYKLAIGAAKLFHIGDLMTYIGLMWTAKDVTELQGWALDKINIKQALMNSTLIKAQAARMGLTAADLAGYSVTQLLTLGVQGLAAGFKNLWLAMGPVGWAILAIVGAATVFTLIFNAVYKTTEELTEELNELKTEFQDIQSEMENVNSELETMEDRMAELLAKDSLSFVEQEELNRLQKENNELQRRLDLLEEEEKIKAKEAGEAFAKTMESYEGKSYTVDGEADFWDKLFGDDIYDSNKDFFSSRMSNYLSTKNNQIKELDRKAIQTELDKLTDAAEGLEYFVGDNLTDKQKEVNEWLDYVYNLEDKWAIAQGGKNAETNAIARIFDKDENAAISDSIDEYVEALRKGDTNAKSSIENIINGNKALVEDLEASGLSAGKAVDYFTSFASELEFATLEGKIAEMQNATSKMQALLSNTKSADFAGLFKEDGDVSVTAIAEYFQGTSEATREEIAKLVKDINDGEISVENALKQFEFFSIQSSLDIYITEVQMNFKDVFVDLEDADGLISTFEELGEAIGSAASALDTLNQAQAEMAYSGHVSIETALQLMEYTDDYGSVLQVVDGKLQLVEGAENNLIQARINAIKTSAEASLSDATNAYNKAVLATQEYKSALTTDMSAEVVAKSWEKVLAAGAGLWEGIKSLITDESWSDAYNRGYDETLSSITGYETEYNDTGLQALVDAEAEAKALMEQAQDRVELANQLTPETLESIHSSEEASGGNDTKEEVEDDRFQREMDYWENRIGANQARYEQLRNEIDLLEAKGQKADASFYKEQIELEGQRLELLNGQKTAAETHLATLTEGSEEWWEVANTLNDIESELDDVTASIVDLQDAIGEIDTYKFEEFDTRLDDITSKLGTIRDLIATNEEDWFDNEGNWTEEGVAVLGTYIQELETYKQGLAEAEDAYANYVNEYVGNEEYYAKLGIHSEKELYDKRQELIEQQYDYAQSISDTEQSVVDMYESNIDAVEEYTETLIDSYNDYIDSVKEALDAERDLYDFKKKIKNQTKEIAAIERRIASLSGSTNASDIAERRRLEANLYGAREELDDTYYDHAKTTQQEALDNEAAAYEETMTRFIDGLRVSLDQATTNMDEFLMSVTSMVTLNADTVLTKYQETELPLGDVITNPWEAAKKAVGDYSGDALGLMNKWTQGGFFTTFPETVKGSLTSPWSSGSTAANAFKTSVSTVMSNVVSNISTNVKTASGELAKLYQQIKDTEKRATEAKVVVNPNPTPPQYPSSPSSSTPTPTPEPTVKLRGLMKTSREMILGPKSFVDANTETINGTKYYRDSNTGYYYKISDLNSKRKYDGGRTTGWAIPKGTWFYTKHAKGTIGTTRDQWAITDEPQFGDELVLVPGKDGNLSFMRKGTGVVPADMTQKLFELAQIPTSDLMNKNLTAIVPNITKNDFKNEFNFESLVHVDKVDSDTLPKLEKMVDKKIDDFSKALNYSLKRFAR